MSDPRNPEASDGTSASSAQPSSPRSDGPAEKSRTGWDEWKARHPERSRAGDKAWTVRNADRVRANQKAWREANAEKVRQAKRKWDEENPDRLRQLNRESMRRAAKRRRDAAAEEAKRQAYSRAHAEERRAYMRRYVAKRRAEDPIGFAEARRAASRRYYERHRARQQALSREHERKDPAARRDTAHAYYVRNAEQIKAKRRGYYQANKEKIRGTQRVYNAKQKARRAAGLPKPAPHRTPREERRRNAVAADAFFARTIDADLKEQLLSELRTPPELLTAWRRDCSRARAAHYAAVTPGLFPPAPAAEDPELARMEQIAAIINERLRTQPRRPAVIDESAPHYAPGSPSPGMSR